MKTLMTFAAVAALISGVSIASAQSNMNGNLAGNAKAGAESGSFCSDINGAQTCKWTSMEACQKEAGPNGECFPAGGKPGASTTGAAPMSAPAGAADNTMNKDTQKGSNSMDKGAASSKGN
jgi:hypothetical protein